MQPYIIQNVNHALIKNVDKSQNCECCKTIKRCNGQDLVLNSHQAKIIKLFPVTGEIVQ